MSAVPPSVPLHKVAALNPPLPQRPELDELVSFLPMSAVDAGAIDVVDHDARRFADVGQGYTPFMADDVLVAKITPCFENGKIAQAKPTHRFAFGSTEFHVVRSDRDALDSRYLVHFLRQDRIRLEGKRKMTGSAGQRRVPEHFLASLQIPLPPLPEQRRIAAILDQADALRTKRCAALTRLDELTQSIFLDMFGDPAINPKGWPVKAMGGLATKFSDGPFGSNLKSKHYTDNGVRVVRLQNIGVGEFIDDDAAYISDDHFSMLKKHECRPGDVLVGTLGDPNLRACIQPKWLTVALNKADCVQIRPDTQVANATFICGLLNQPSTERMARNLMLGQTRVRISMGRLRGLHVPVPPIKLQREFEARVAAVEKLRAKQLSAQTHLAALFAAIRHCAFRGEL